MGRDKAMLEIDGVPLVVRAARLLEPLVGEPTVIAQPASYAKLGLRVVADDRAGFGPLGGIATALRISPHPWNLIIGCDLPHLSGAWLAELIERAAVSAADAVLPENARGLEPLCAMYHRRGGPSIAAALDRGVRKVTEGLAELAILRIAPSEWESFDSAGRLFENVNAPEDYEKARGEPGQKEKQ